MCALIDPVTGNNLPTLRLYQAHLVCACDMCYSVFDQVPSVSVGPHDLHCLCTDCLKFALDDDVYQDALHCRYPDLFDMYNVVPIGVGPNDFAEDILSMQNSNYIPPSNSPTNKEMHAYNGNESWSNFVRAAARGVAGSRQEPDRFAASALSSIGLLGGGLLYTSAQNMAKPLAELRDQIFGPSNKEMHAYNGNMFPSDLTKGPKVGDFIDGTPNKFKKDREKHKDIETLFPGINTNPSVHDIIDIGKNGRLNNLRRKIPRKSSPVNDVVIDSIHKIPSLDGNPALKQIKEELLKPTPDIGVLDSALNTLSASYPELVKTGPSNKEMHSYNGNIVQGPVNKNITKKVHRKQLRKLARKINKQHQRVKIKTKTVYKARRLPGGVKQAAVVEKREIRIARMYSKFLRDPVARPIKLGSTGINPTKMLHGYYEITFNTAAPGLGGGLTNVTDIICWLPPKMFKYYLTPSNFFGPINIGTAINSTTAFTNVASTSAIDSFDFANVAALKNEAGVPTSTTSTPLARFVGGHVSIRCRCPMATTAPPFIYGGLLPSEPHMYNNTGPVADPAQQINQLTSQQIRALKSTKEIDGFEGSSVYVPGSAVDLQFTPNILEYNSATAPMNPVPYIGMTGCPTTANVTIMVSAWFEIQQNANNMAYSGWGKGPKVSAEDVFDHLPNIKSVNGYSLNLGSKSNASQTISSILKPLPKAPEQQIDDLRLELAKLSHRINELTVDIPYEDEKYILPSPPHSPNYKSLSRSTIDLALHLKDKLTPGSVTSKTTRNQLP